MECSVEPQSVSLCCVSVHLSPGVLCSVHFHSVVQCPVSYLLESSILFFFLSKPYLFDLNLIN